MVTQSSGQDLPFDSAATNKRRDKKVASIYLSPRSPVRRQKTHTCCLRRFVCDQHKRMAYRGSVRPFVNFNAQHDAEVLNKAMKGIGTDEDVVLMLLSARSNDQRQQIKAAYKKTYGKDLVSTLKSELGGLFENLIVALMTPPTSYDAFLLHRALKGAGTEDNVLIEILASRSGEQIKDIIKVYKKEFNGKLEKDICGDTSGHYQQLLVILLQGSREEGVDEEKIEKDAEELFAAGEAKFGTDEEKFITILGNRSAEHLLKVFDAYKKLSGSDIEDSVEGETTGNLENLLLAVVKCARSVPQFFAESLYKSMRRAGTDDGALMRIMVSRSEVDMLDIRASFKKTYGASLYTTIQEDTTGDYQKALLYLCGGND
ncbi:annexin A5a [Clinocottus analis]|uniref:annexin A5a n=1 Tax=Clinocottus analis TaxID=304258 RepID=UPI0035BF396F